MSDQTISISLNNIQKIIRADEIPAVNGPMRSVIDELNREVPTPKSLSALPERVKDLAEAKELLQKAKSHSLRDKILSIVSLSVCVGLVAATILGFLINPLLGMALLVTLLTILLYCHMKATGLGQKDKREAQNFLSMYPLGVLASPFILSYFLWTRVSSLKATVASCQQDIQSYALETIQYWASMGAPAAKRVDIEKERAAKTLSAMQKLPIRSPQGENDLREYNDLLLLTRIEIEKGRKLALRNCGSSDKCTSSYSRS